MGSSRGIKPPHKRLFIGIKVPLDIRFNAIIDTIQNDFNKCRIRWTKPANYHLTLRFLGNTPISLIPSISQLLSEITSNFNTFQLKIESVGYFNPGKPKILWFGIKACNELKKLSVDINHALASIGIEHDSLPNHPHVTIGRIKDLDPAFRINDCIGNYNDLYIKDIDVLEICLFESRTEQNGPVYTVLESHRLK